MKVLITGAAGFIGQHVASAVRKAGHEVTCLDLLVSSAHGEDPAVPEGIRRADVRSPSDLDAVLHEIDVVCHQAAIVGAGVDSEDAPAYASHNDFGTAVLLAAMARSGCRRLVLASSMVVYGDGAYRCEEHGQVRPEPRSTADLDAGIFDRRCPQCQASLGWEMVDESAPLRPRSLYAASKLAQENYTGAWSLACQGAVTALRYHNVYGDFMPRNTPYSGVAAMFRSSLEAGRAPTVFEDGRQARDFIHVSDVATANLLAIEQPLGGFVPLNIGSGTPITVGEVAQALARAKRGPAPQITGQYRHGDVRHIVADSTAATAALGFRARVNPDDGIATFATAPLRDASAAGPPRV